MALLASSLLFCKLIFFKQYRRFNVPVKLCLVYLYTATLDPLSVYSGYYYDRYLSPRQAHSQSGQ